MEMDGGDDEMDDEDEGLIKGYNLRRVKSEVAQVGWGVVKGEGMDDMEGVEGIDGEEGEESAEEEGDGEYVPEPVPVKREGLGMRDEDDFSD